MAVWLVEHCASVPSESSVMTPCEVVVPTVTWAPPVTFSGDGLHPCGSSSHSAGGLPVASEGRTVAVRTVVPLAEPKTVPKKLLSLCETITRIRLHAVPSLFPAPVQYVAISDAGTG